MKTATHDRTDAMEIASKLRTQVEANDLTVAEFKWAKDRLNGIVYHDDCGLEWNAWNALRNKDRALQELMHPSNLHEYKAFCKRQQKLQPESRRALAQAIHFWMPIVELVDQAKAIAKPGRRPASKEGKQLTLLPTGTCYCCGRDFVITPRGLADHGFHISDGRGRYLGYRDGQCLGNSKRPWQESPETGDIYRRSLERRIASLKKEFDFFMGDKPEWTEIGYKGKPKTWSPGVLGYEDRVIAKRRATLLGIHQAEDSLERTNKDIETWKPQPLKTKEVWA